MARADRRRVQRAKPHAGAGRRDTPRRDSDLAAIEDTLFFTRIRSHAKWVFVFLALSFLIGFVVFNVGGSGSGGGIGELLRNDGSNAGGNVSVSEAREQVQKNPKSAQAHRNLATALETDGETDEAIVALNGYLDLRPKDQEALRELAGLHLGQGSQFAQEAQLAQLRASYVTFGSTFGSSLDLGKGATIGPDPIDQAIATEASEAVNERLHQGPDGVPERAADVSAARRARAEGSEHPARARPGGTAGRRRPQGDLCVRGVPEARPGRPERGHRQTADRAAEGHTGPGTVGLDSAATGKTTPTCSQSAGAHIR